MQRIWDARFRGHVCFCSTLVGGRRQSLPSAAGSHELGGSFLLQGTEHRPVPLEPPHSPVSREAICSARYKTHQHLSSRHWPKYRQWLQGREEEKKKKVHVLLYLQMLPSSSNKHWQWGTIDNQSDVKGEERRHGCPRMIAVIRPL